MSADKLIKTLKDEDFEFVDLRFCDTRGKEQHVSLPVSVVDEDLFEEGKMFDGSSIGGWKGINESDMVLMPEAGTFWTHPAQEMIIRCDWNHPWRATALSRSLWNGPAYLVSAVRYRLLRSGLEFFVFDDVRFSVDMHGCSYHIDSEEGAWNSEAEYEGGNIGHRPGVKGGYFPVPPVDSLQDLRSEMCRVLAQVGQTVEVHHHEVGTAGQCEIGTRFSTLTRKADESLMLKYVVHNVAHAAGQTATFMPKPLVGDNGSGMHIHQSLAKGGKNLFTGDGYGGLSQTALHYIGGIFKHAKSINAFANSTTNSYKRLVPGFEAPVMLAYSARNRSASCRIPFVSNPKGRRIEVRFGDPASNCYLVFAAMMMAGLDGIANKIDPGSPMDKDLYDLPPEEAKAIPQVCSSLDQALDALDGDREFLKAGGVFSDDLIDAYIDLKMHEVTRFRMSTHPVEFEMYYSL
jgi:glutamine synthetase